MGIFCGLLGWIWGSFCPSSTPATPVLAPPICVDFTTTISEYGTISFNGKISSERHAFSSVQVKFSSNPNSGTLLYNTNQAALETLYANTAMSYRSYTNIAQCAYSFNDPIYYYAYTDKYSGRCTLTINNSTFNCRPTISNMNLTVTYFSSIDFTNYVNDTETSDDGLQVIFNSLPTIGSLTINDSPAAVNTWYYTTGIVFTSPDSHCLSAFNESITWRTRDPSD